MQPTTIRHTKRQRVTTDTGTVLERSYIFLPPESWEALKQLSIDSYRSNSQVIESLINFASRGTLVKDINDQKNRNCPNQ